jgi:predicted Zn-dependent protease
MIRVFGLAGIAVAVGALIPFGGSPKADAFLSADGRVLKWRSQARGMGTVISYAVLTDAFRVPQGRRTLSPDNCGSMQPFADIIKESPDVSVEEAKQELKAAFAAWEAFAGLTFVEIDDASRANIVVGAAHSPLGRAFANLSVRSDELPTPVSRGLGKAHSETRGTSSEAVGRDESGFVAIEQAYVCLSQRSRWKIGFDGNLDIYDLRYTFTHEIGHAIGLDHPGKSGSLMAYRYEEHVQQLTPSDVSAVQKLYGSRTSGPQE